MAEQYVRPPLIATEPPSARAARWRFRVLAGLLLALLTVVFVLIFLRVSGVAVEDPGLTVGLPAYASSAPSGTLSTARVPRG